MITMMRSLLILLVFIASLQTVASLLVGNARNFGVKSPCRGSNDALRMSSANDFAANTMLDRRSILSILSTATLVSTFPLPSIAADDEKKIVVFGGSGYVGAHVDKLLLASGAKVVSVSRSSPDDQAARVSKILGQPLSGVEYVSLDASTDNLTSVLKGASAVVSCVGIAPGGQNQLDGNGAVNIRIADAAQAAGIKRFVYISVASSLANSPAKFLLKDYFTGKSQAEAGVIRDFSAKQRLVVKPSIIAGAPPGEVRPPGPPGTKPIPVEAVAKVVVAGALGETSGSVDGNDAIAAFE